MRDSPAQEKEILQTHIADAVLYITMNHPQKKNALDQKMCAALCDAIERADSDPNIKVVVLRSAIGVFCAGGDIKAMRDRSDIFSGDSRELALSYRQSIQKIPLSFASLSKPSIALVAGAAVGAGFDLACMCDFRLATPAASFSESFASLGLISGIGGAFHLTRILGLARATDLALTGRTIQATEALAWGLVNKICQQEDLESSCGELVAKLQANSAAALAQTKVLLRQAALSSLEEHLYLASTMQGVLQTDPDHLKRVTQKLKP